MKITDYVKMTFFSNCTDKAVVRLMMTLMFIIMFIVGFSQEGQAAPTQAQIDNAINTGFAWLVSQQTAGVPANGSLNGSFSGDGYYAANTGFALAALEHNAERLGYKPLDTAYAYHTNIQNGLDYLLANAQYDSTNGWVYWNVGGDDSYQTGIPLMAISRSGVPNQLVTVGPLASGKNGGAYTYKEVAQMAVNWLATAQDTLVNRPAGNGSGGWAYNKSSPYGDQSATGWAAMGLGYAKSSMGCTIPATVLTALSNMNTGIQTAAYDGSVGGADYTYGSNNYWHNVYKTGHLLYDLGLVGADKNSTAVTNAIKFMDVHWAQSGPTGWGSGQYGWRGAPPSSMPSYAGMFSASKGFSEFGIDTFTVAPASGGTGITHDWYNDFAQVIIDTQYISGNNSWTGGSGGDGVAIRGTAEALLVLVRAQSFLPPVATSSAASNITTASATINGNLTSMGSSTSVDVTFQYGTLPGVYNQETAIQTFTSTSPFTVTLNNLALNTTFYYRSKAVGTTNGTPTGTGYSAEISFTTPSTLTYLSSITNGTATPVSYTNIPYPNDNTVRAFTFTPNTGYHLTGVSSSCAGTASPASPFSYTNDTLGQTTASYTFSTPATTSCTATATTALNNYTITASATDNNGSSGVGGSVSCPATAAYNVDPTCTFSPAPGYHVYDVIVDGSSVWSNTSASGVNTTLGSRALGATTGSRTLLVKFRKDTYLVTTTPGANGTITPANSYFDVGTTPTLTVAGNAGYYVTAIGGSCGTAYNNSLPDYNVMSKSYTTNTIAAACNITATYALGYRYISKSISPPGTATLTCPASVIHGQTGSCTLTPNSGYHIVGISGCFGSLYSAAPYINGTAGEISNSFSLGTVINDCTVTAITAINKFDMTVTPDSHSKINAYALNTPHTYQNISYNAAQSVTFTADTGYHLTGITDNCSGAVSATYSNNVNGPWATTAILSPAAAIVSGVAANCGITATSAINVYSITPTIATTGP